ncbi:hypothetical protein [Arthrobacter sp. C9C5]|uniref:hypothetical protein n=1 Tax=Arthrobacter sp. C9C5 TaxID=2735267 RepID=UPI0015859414|nr:hypothetical protein [Arthrobacter sp. C9C5]NUU31322.1 hypothetical protein [Arthrobacter sp. C9C5]
MSWTGPGGRAAALCTAVVLLGTLAIPAQAAPAATKSVPGLRMPATPELPTPGEIAAAKASEGATADQVNRIDRILADASAAKEAGLATSLAANNAYADALVELQIRRDAAELAEAKAAAAESEQKKARTLIGQLAGDLYRNGGMTPALGSLVGGNGEALQQAATLEAVAASRTRAFQSAETAAAAAQSSKDAAAEADRAADDAARTAESRKADAGTRRRGQAESSVRGRGAADGPGRPTRHPSQHHRGTRISAGGCTGPAAPAGTARGIDTGSVAHRTACPGSAAGAGHPGPTVRHNA